MPNFRNFLSRRLLIGIAIAALLLSLAMLHPYPRQSLFGPTIRGKPWCVWEAEVRTFANWEDHGNKLSVRVMAWLGFVPEQMPFVALFDHPEMLPLLIEMAECDDVKCRFAILTAFSACEKLNHRSALPMLQRRMRDDIEEHRQIAMNAICTIEQEPRILIEALDDPSDTNYRWAVILLYELGPKAKAAIPILERRVNDKNPLVKMSVEAALAEIDPERFGHLKAKKKIE